MCIWCNRICGHALMFKKHIIFQILYIFVVPLCPASFKCIVFYKVPPSNNHSLLWLANWHSALWLAEQHKHVSEMFYQFKPERGTVTYTLIMLLVTCAHSASERRFIVPSQRGTKTLSLTFTLTVLTWWNDLPNSETAKKISSIFFFDLLTLALSILILFYLCLLCI